MNNSGRTLALLLCGGALSGCDVVFASYLTHAVDAAVTDAGAVSDADPSAAPDALSDAALFDAAPAGPPCPVDEPDLVLCLPFDGNPGDLSKNAFAAVAPAPILSYTDGRIGQAAVFSRNTLFKLSDGAAWAVPAYTFEVWVRPDALPAEPVMRFGLLDRTGRFGVFLHPSTDVAGELTLLCGLNGDRILGPNIPLSTWSHIACSTDGATMSLYLNGQLHKRQASASTPIAGITGPTHVGSNEPDGDARMVGALDELRLYSRVRTDEQIRQAYLRGTAR